MWGFLISVSILNTEISLTVTKARKGMNDSLRLHERFSNRF